MNSQFHLTLPPFNDGDAAQPAMQLQPPFSFTGMTNRVLPLRANRYVLQSFVDASLNIIPEDAGRFDVLVPYVYLCILNYGKMAVEAANLGWISQNEVAFGIPVIWSHRVDGELRKDFAFFTPFIYVDNPLSMATGREVYGWPKVLASFDPSFPSWMQHPVSSRQLTSMSVGMLRESYDAQSFGNHTLLELTSAPAPSLFQLPMDATKAPWPWNIARQLAKSTQYLAQASVAALYGLTAGFCDSNHPLALLHAMRRIVPPGELMPAWNTMTLKQFRDVAMPDNAAYQAVCNTPMQIKGIRAGGMLGDAQLLRGATSGGIRMRLYDFDTQPIADSLGLQADYEAPDNAFREFEPVCPFWMEMDMEYPLAQTLAWRQNSGNIWHCVGGDLHRSGTSTFNTSLGAAGQEIPGPYNFDRLELRILPLLADRVRLTQLIDAYLNRALATLDSVMEVEPWGDHVYFVARSSDATFSESNDIGNLGADELNIYVPVRWYRRDASGERVLMSAGLVPLSNYSSSSLRANSSSSIEGIPTVVAKFSAPASRWLLPRNKDKPQHFEREEVMEVSAYVLPDTGSGQQASERVVFEISEYDELPDEQTRARKDWHRLKQRIVGAKTNDIPDAARLAAMEILYREHPINILTLKQFRDAASPTDACYQALVSIPTRMKRLKRLERAPRPIELRIHNFESSELVRTLGLHVYRWEEGKGSRIAVILPDGAFEVSCRARQDLGENLAVWEPQSEPSVSATQEIQRNKDASRLCMRGSALAQSLSNLARGKSIEEIREIVAQSIVFSDDGDSHRAPSSGEQLRNALAEVSPLQLLRQSIAGESFDSAGPSSE